MNTKMSLRHIALHVSDLQAAEAYYQELFGMDLVGRESELEKDVWYTLPFDKTWEDAKNAGIKLQMSALRKDEVVIALILGNAPSGQVFAIGISISQNEIENIRSRLPEDTKIMADFPDFLEFCDSYGIVWQISVPGNEFKTIGNIADRWIDV